jgi:hypothetical protein
MHLAGALVASGPKREGFDLLKGVGIGLTIAAGHHDIEAVLNDHIADPAVPRRLLAK